MTFVAARSRPDLAGATRDAIRANLLPGQTATEVPDDQPFPPLAKAV